MATFCRITGKARGLPKPNYFPLLPPISPADAKRFCRITGKSYGLPSHHFIPVLVGRPRSGRRKPHSEKRHVLIAGYRYVFPCLDNEPDLRRLLDEKSPPQAANATAESPYYVYPVGERQCGLVFSAQLEAAVRDGDVRDVLLAKDADTLLLKLKRGGNISVDVKNVDVDLVGELYEGSGVATVTTHKSKKSTNTGSIRKIFEDKETAAELEATPPIKQKQPETRKWNNTKNDVQIVVEDPACKVWQWGEFSEGGDSAVLARPTPVDLTPIAVDLSTSRPGVVQQPHMNEDFVGLPTAQIVAPFQPLNVELDQKLLNAITTMTDEDLERTSGLETVLANQWSILPTVGQVAEVVDKIGNGESHVVEKDGLKVEGLQVGDHFLVGQKLEGEFVPGQTVDTTSGQVFVPGLVVRCGSGSKLLPGCLLPVGGEKNQRQFVAGQITLTNNGEQFVPGQVVQSASGTKFQPGQTVVTEQGIQFISGQVVDDRFVPGQVIVTGDGPQFVAGQAVDTAQGTTTFIPGQSFWAENGWQFVPGVTLPDGSFVAGRHSTTNDNFCPGQYVQDSNGMEVFVPGVAVRNELGELQFVGGMTVQTPEGEAKFVQGRIATVGGAQTFVPGSLRVVEGQEVFSAAASFEELSYLENQSVESLSQMSRTSAAQQEANSVFGHIVQSAHGVEFFPGAGTCLPRGKVVPGRLVRAEEIKFVPGIMMEDTFVPGQVVMTERGEQFVPGQVIETTNGPKFVPGRIIPTDVGEKFLPGQIVDTEEGPKFVPGQIIETRAGPTFIPGQVIHTDEGGAQFVPGQVVETREGPRFVPGRVVEAGDHVTFVPGQVVETAEGLRFVAPDLEEDEFTVQGYKVSTEELKLLQSTGSSKAAAVETREMAIDSTMMQQLSKAGIPIGYQVNTDMPAVNIRSAPALNAAVALGRRLHLDPVTTVKLSEVIAGVVQASKLGGELGGSSDEVQTINRILERVVHCKSDEEAHRIVASIIEKETGLVASVDLLHSFLLSVQSPLRRPNKVSVVKQILNCQAERSEVFKKMAVVMEEEDDTVTDALHHFSQASPEIVDQIVQRFSDTVGKLESEQEVIETLRCAIVASVRASSERAIVDLLKDAEALDLRALILEAVALAKALDLQEAATMLLTIAANPKSTNVLAGDRVTLEILRRLTVMRQLAERRPELLDALKNLNCDPIGARSDPAIRQLVRESAALLVVPESGGVRTSAQVPSALFFSQNSLAIEDFLYRTKTESKILVISKLGCEAVIPREAAHAVLAGTLPYVLLDEKGLHHFQPKHVFAAINLPRIATNWFSLYKCEFKEVVTN